VRHGRGRPARALVGALRHAQPRVPLPRRRAHGTPGPSSAVFLPLAAFVLDRSVFPQSAAAVLDLGMVRPWND